MKRFLVPALVVLAIAAAAAAASRWWRPAAPAWTTDSPEALAALEAGDAAAQKLYTADAAAQFARALEHDPDFVIAKLRVVQLGRASSQDPQRVAELLEEIRGADPARLNEREALLVRYFLARIDREPERATEVLDAYLVEHPDDPYAIELSCGIAFSTSALDEAESCYRRLIELDPNRVVAQNLLGYLAMARGDFAAAEEQFEVYRYVAPDQANPHDSLGELYLVVGRYDDAEREFEQAVAVKYDFCASWGNLVLVELLREDYAAADERAAAAQRAGGCGEALVSTFDCRIDLWRTIDQGDWSGVIERGEECRKQGGDLLVLSAWAARASGRPEVAATIEEQVASFGTGEPMVRAVLAHLEGLRLLAGGDPAAASERFRTADRELHYQSEQWLFKLFNLRALARALADGDRPQDAARVRAEIEAVNPRVLSGGSFEVAEAALPR